MAIKKIIIPKDNNVLKSCLEEFIKKSKLDAVLDESLHTFETKCTFDNEECIQSVVDKAKLIYQESEDTITVAYEEGIHYNIYNVDNENTLAEYTVQIWVAIFDGDEMYFGSSASFPIPYKVGKEIGDLGITPDKYMSRLIDGEVSEEVGYIGKVTRGNITKKDLIKQAIEVAIFPLTSV